MLIFILFTKLPELQILQELFPLMCPSLTWLRFIKIIYGYPDMMICLFFHLQVDRHIMFNTLSSQQQDQKKYAKSSWKPTILFLQYGVQSWRRLKWFPTHMIEKKTNKIMDLLSLMLNTIPSCNLCTYLGTKCYSEHIRICLCNII